MSLTPTEHRVAELVARGYTNEAIAFELGIASPRAVSVRLQSVYSKLHLSGDPRRHPRVLLTRYMLDGSKGGLKERYEGRTW